MCDTLLLPACEGWTVRILAASEAAGLGYCSGYTCMFWEECGSEGGWSNTDYVRCYKYSYLIVASEHFAHTIQMVAKHAEVARSTTQEYYQVRCPCTASKLPGMHLYFLICLMRKEYTIY